MSEVMNLDEFDLKFPSMNRSLNDKEDIKVGWDAVVLAIFNLLSTPINSLPYTPSLGFDLHEFLFRAVNGTEINKLEMELADKITIVTGARGKSINTQIHVEKQIVYIDVTYTKDLKEYRMPIRLEPMNDGTIRLNDIQVK